MGFRYKTTYDEDRNAFFNAIAPLDSHMIHTHHGWHVVW